MFKKIGLIGIALSSFLVCGASSAAIITGSGSTAVQTDFVDLKNNVTGAAGGDGLQDFGTPGLNPIFDTFVFDQFDDMGGTRVLTSVLLTLNGEIQGLAEAENTSNALSNIRFIADIELSLLSLSGNQLIATFPEYDEIFLEVAAFDGTIDNSGVSGRSTTFGGVTDSASETITTQSVLDLFVGNGTISLNLEADSFLAVSFTGGNGPGQVLADATAISTLQYNYNTVARDVSAPNTLLTLSLVLVIAGLRSRK